MAPQRTNLQPSDPVPEEIGCMKPRYDDDQEMLRGLERDEFRFFYIREYRHNHKIGVFLYRYGRGLQFSISILNPTDTWDRQTGLREALDSRVQYLTPELAEVFVYRPSDLLKAAMKRHRASEDRIRMAMCSRNYEQIAAICRRASGQ